MSFKQFIPDITNEWDSYWKRTSIRKELALTETDGLRPIFQKHLKKKGKILEAGCGLGKWVISLSKSGYQIQGVDNNKYAIEKIKKYFPQAKVKVADVKKLPFQDEEFDAYLSLGVVEHFEEGPQKALSEARRVLKKGGEAIVEVPFDSPLRQISRILNKFKYLIKTPVRLFLELIGIRTKRKKIKTRFYEYRYTKAELMKFMKQAGFSKITIYPKDDLSQKRSIALWLDYQYLHKPEGEIFELNKKGIMIKKFLEFISPFSYIALIVAVAQKD